MSCDRDTLYGSDLEYIFESQKPLSSPAEIKFWDKNVIDRAFS